MRATTVLVEGESDRVAVETLACRDGHDLTAERVTVVPMGGATSIGHVLDRYGPAGAGHRLLGLCDAAESRGVARALARAGVGSGSLAELGFQVCYADRANPQPVPPRERQHGDRVGLAGDPHHRRGFAMVAARIVRLDGRGVTGIAGSQHRPTDLRSQRGPVRPPLRPARGRRARPRTARRGRPCPWGARRG